MSTNLLALVLALLLAPLEILALIRTVSVLRGRDAPHPGAPELAGPAPLALLLAAFLFRVLAQLVAAVAPTGALPPFAAWQGSALPYPLLLAAQGAIALGMAWAVLRRARGGRVVPARWRRPVLLGALVYFGVMAFRFVAGLSVLAAVPWFAAALPAVFHMVLATFLLLLAAADDPRPRPAESRHGEYSR